MPAHDVRSSQSPHHDFSNKIPPEINSLPPPGDPLSASTPVKPKRVRRRPELNPPVNPSAPVLIIIVMRLGSNRWLSRCGWSRVPPIFFRVHVRTLGFLSVSSKLFPVYRNVRSLKTKTVHATVGSTPLQIAGNEIHTANISAANPFRFCFRSNCDGQDSDKDVLISKNVCISRAKI
jgi:hypothetical protein